MRTLVLILLLTVLTVLFVVGCSDDPVKPEITRLTANETCGVAPLAVSFRVDATGGAPENEPTGSNNWLNIEWDFDGTGLAGGTAVAYHVYDEPGFYTVLCKVVDADGEFDLDSLHVEVRADTLAIAQVNEIDGELITEVEVCRPFDMDIVGSACGFDSASDNQDRFVFEWTVGDSTYAGVRPFHTFEPEVLDDADPLEQVTVRVFDPVLDIYRSATSTVTALASAGADLSASVDWTSSPLEPTSEDTLVRAVDQFPDLITFTVTVQNDGAAAGYNVRVDGELPTEDAEGDGDVRMVVLDGEPFAGDYQYYPAYVDPDDADNNRDAFWTWFIPEIPAGESVTLNVNLMFEAADKFDMYSFPVSIQDYWCDADTLDNDAEAVYELSSAPSDVMLAASWGATGGGGSSAEIARQIPAGGDFASSFPDSVAYTMSVLNEGPSDAFDLVVTGTLPDDPAITFAEERKPFSTDFEYDDATRTWTWTIPRAGDATNLTIGVLIAEQPLDTSFEFPATIEPYAEDPTPEDHDAAASYRVFNSVTDLGLSTAWHDTEGNELSADNLPLDVENFPTRLVLHHEVTNSGPYLFRELFVVGNLGASTDAFQIRADASAFEYTPSAGEFLISEAGEWIWNLDELADGATATLDISFDLDQDIAVTEPGFWYTLYAALGAFPGDFTDDNNEVESQLAIRSLPEK